MKNHLNESPESYNQQEMKTRHFVQAEAVNLRTSKYFFRSVAAFQVRKILPVTLNLKEDTVTSLSAAGEVIHLKNIKNAILLLYCFNLRLSLKEELLTLKFETKKILQEKK